MELARTVGRSCSTMDTPHDKSAQSTARRCGILYSLSVSDSEGKHCSCLPDTFTPRNLTLPTPPLMQASGTYCADIQHQSEPCKEDMFSQQLLSTVSRIRISLKMCDYATIKCTSDWAATKRSRASANFFDRSGPPQLHVWHPVAGLANTTLLGAARPLCRQVPRSDL